MFPALTYKKYPLQNYGQSLIEIIATIAIGTVLILALVALSVRSSSSSDFSKAQSQAARLAAEGLEVINYLKQTDGNVAYSGSDPGCVGSSVGGTSWDVFFVLDIDDQAAGCTQYGRPGILNQPAPGQWELRLTTNSGEAINLNNRTFTRYMYVADTPAASSGKSTCNAGSSDHTKIKQFTARVTWTDSGGPHESITTSCIKRV